jgi:hypothetical protein
LSGKNEQVIAKKGKKMAKHQTGALLCPQIIEKAPYFKRFSNFSRSFYHTVRLPYFADRKAPGLIPGPLPPDS